jgi:hypothetical protein
MLKRGDRTAAIGPIVSAVAGRAMVAGEAVELGVFMLTVRRRPWTTPSNS